MIGFTISTTTLSYLFIFPTYLILRYKYPNVHRPYTVPGGIIGAWIVTLFPLAYAAVGSYFMLAAVFYVWGQLEKRNQDVVVELELGGGTEIAPEPVSSSARQGAS